MLNVSLTIFKECNMGILFFFFFPYAIQIDEARKAVNFFFWVDARSRAAYEAFGDVVTFDTTYRKNKYGLLFTPFSGVNHHYQTIQFGCTFFAR